MFARLKAYPSSFWLLCLSTFLFFFSFNFVIAELPALLIARGGVEQLGLIIGLFTLSAGMSRPFSGRLADTIGRLPVIVAGVIVAAASGVFYLVLSGVWGLLAVRFIHGFAAGFSPTGNAALVADLVSDKNRGEAIGWIGFAASTGTAGGPALGSFVAQNFSHTAMFLGSSGLALLSLLIIMRLPETLVTKVPFAWQILKLKKNQWFANEVRYPAVLMCLSSIGFGIILTLNT